MISRQGSRPSPRPRNPASARASSDFPWQSAGDLLDEPGVAVGVAERAERPVAGTRGVWPGEPCLRRERCAVPDVAYVDAQVDPMLKDGVVEPKRLADITRLPLREISRDRDVLRVGAVVKMEELAADVTNAARLPLVREALLAGASPQLRNMATIGGNILQRTRCRYFRDLAVAACNERVPRSGCAAVSVAARMHRILGASQHCIALHASDLCVALAALDAVAHIQAANAELTISLTEFYVVPGDRPDVENVLRHGELLTVMDIPLLASGY
jgi:CO/xanthine dehydrogenase FAD-binding subunit